MKNTEKEEKEKHEEKQAKKRKTELEQLDIIKTKESRTRTLTEESPQASAEKSKHLDTQVKGKDEESDPAELPPRRKMLAKKERHNSLHHLLTTHLSRPR